MKLALHKALIYGNDYDHDDGDDDDDIFSTFTKRKRVYKLIYKSCYEKIYISVVILILLFVLNTRCFLQIQLSYILTKMLFTDSFIVHTDRDRSHFHLNPTMIQK